MLVALCKHVYTSKTIIFCQCKSTAHRLKILFGLLDLKAAELHGNLTQTQRLDSLELFRDQAVDFLIATDLASRGLDIVGIQTVINFQMPKTQAQYVHRVGRTARAGKSGRACSFISEADRVLLRDIVKKAADNVISKRKIPAEKIKKYFSSITELQTDIDAVILEEREERAIRIAERDIDKAQNMINHRDEIYSRPKRTWFQTTQEKAASKENSRLSVMGPDAENDDDQPESVPEQTQTHLSERQLKKKEKRDREILESKKRTMNRKKRRKLEQESSVKDTRKAIRTSKASFKPQKLHSITSFAKKPTKSSSKSKKPKKPKTANPFADAGRKKHPEKQKSKKRYKRR